MLHTLVSRQSSLLSKGAKLNKIPGPNWVWNSHKVQEDTHIELTIIENPLAKKCKSTLPFENTLTPYHGIVWIPRIHGPRQVQIGWALDGAPIMGPFKDGLRTKKSMLDECHGAMDVTSGEYRSLAGKNTSQFQIFLSVFHRCPLKTLVGC